MRELAQPALDYLDARGIAYRYADHPAVFTIAEMDALGLENPDEVAKNLFLCDSKKRRFFLVVMSGHSTADLASLGAALGVKLSFASEHRLTEHLGLTKGSVTPLGIINDEARAVEVIFDAEVLRWHEIGVHPNTNTASVWLSPQDLYRLVEEHGNPVRVMEI